MVSNTGTYLDTPFHRFADGHDLAGLDLERVVDVPGVLVDATGVQEAGADLLAGVDVDGRAVLFHTGWASRWGTDDYGDQQPSVRRRRHSRGARRGWRGRGRHRFGEHRLHRRWRAPDPHVLLGAGIPIVEHLCRLDELAGRAFRFTAAPPAVRGMGTFPVRAYAITD